MCTTAAYAAVIMIVHIAAEGHVSPFVNCLQKQTAFYTHNKCLAT